MSTLPDLLRRFVDAAPELHQWYADALEDEIPSDTWLHLTFPLLDGSADDVRHRLVAVAPLLEEALRDHDVQDQVSLGLIETMIGEAEERNLDTLAIRETLGPLAGEHWDTLSENLHQGEWVMIELRERSIAGLPGFPLRFDGWQMQSGGWVPSGGTVATFHFGEIVHGLVATVACKVDRLAAEPGQEFGEGDLLCYLLPADYRHFGLATAYLTLRGVAGRQ